MTVSLVGGLETLLQEHQFRSAGRCVEGDRDLRLVAPCAFLLPRPGKDQALGALNLAIHASGNEFATVGCNHDGAVTPADSQINLWRRRRESFRTPPLSEDLRLCPWLKHILRW